jgi:hypothetical protein
VKPAWTNVTLRGEVIGYVYPLHHRWVAVMEPVSKTGREVGTFTSKQEAMNAVTAAYLRT